MKKICLFISFIFFIYYSWSQEYQDMIHHGQFTVEEIQEKAYEHFDIIGTGKGSGFKQFKRWEYNALRLMDANGKLKSSQFYYNELERYNQYLNENVSNRSESSEGSWQELGPTSWNATSGWNPGVGRITSIAFETGNTNHIIVGAETGGVWKTTDGGTTWSVLTDNLSNLVVYSLTIDPTNPSIYFWGSNGGVIFKSTDAGATWNLLANAGNGVINKILIDPNDTNKMYCSSESNSVAGLFKSIDGGLNWTIIHPDALYHGYDVEFKPGDTNTVYASGLDFFKSTDGGTTFQKIENPSFSFTQEYVSGTTNWVANNGNLNNSVSPKSGVGLGLFYIENYTQPITKLVSQSLDLTGATSPELKFSYTLVSWAPDIDELKVYYKTSVGGTWMELAHYTTEVTNWVDITLNLPNPSADYYIAFEGIANFAQGVTLDDISVEDSALGVMFQYGFESNGTGFANDPKMIGVSADNPDIVYLLEATGYTGLFKSTNSGETFSKLNHDGKNYLGYSTTASTTGGQAPRDMDIAVNPNDVNEVHIAGINTWKSNDGGENFTITSQWNVNNATSLNIGYCHADVDILEYVNGKLYAGTDGGIFVAEMPNNAIDTNYYTDLSIGLGIRQFYRFGVSQTNPAIASGGAQDNGTSFMDTSGNWFDWLGADGMESFIDRNNSDILYGTTQFGNMYKTTDGGSTSTNIAEPNGGSGRWVTPFEQDPIANNTIYVGYNYVYKSTNGGTSWNAISQNFVNPLSHLKIASSNNLVMYASLTRDLFKTEDGGTTNWTQLLDFNNNFEGIKSIAIHPSDPNKIALATSDSEKVHVSIDGGTTWTSYLYNLPNFEALSLVWEDNGNDGLYLGMNYGVYYIDNTLTEWQPFSNNLPNIMVNELEINTVENKIYAATYGRGLWRSDLYDTTLSTAYNEKVNTITISPNPAVNNINIFWDKNDDVTIKIFNALGKIVHYKKNVNLADPYTIDVSKLSSGLYFVRINNAKSVITKKVVIE